ncbi:MAG: ComEC/Rec2 family competence protein [Lentisphaeria bacterium]|nr:ComEC/Rec2 family competence protein [Lentisphaeria bacterium]
MKEAMRQLISLAPMLWCLVACYLGASCSAHEWPLWTLLVCGGLLLALLRAAGASWRKALLFEAIFFSVWILGKLLLSGVTQSYIGALPRDESRVKFKLLLVQTPMSSGRLGKWDVGRGQTIGEMLSVQTVMSKEPCEASGRVSLQTDDIFMKENLRGMEVGDVLAGTGVLVCVPGAEDDVNGFYGEYLKANGILRELQLEEFSLVGRDRTMSVRFSRFVRNCRELLGDLLLRGVKDELSAQMLLALGLGLGEFIPSESRSRQVSSGTVHVFAISGMHVGMVALIISLLVRWCGLPLKLQWAVTALLDSAYVLLTGASPSGMRALLMALLVLYAHFRWRVPSWLNTLGLAGTAGILANPLVVLNLGFVYSYGIVAMLLMLSPVTRRLNDVLSERNAWVPRELRRHRLTKVHSWVINGLFVSGTAWLGSAGISMRVNHRVSLLAPLINLPLGAMVYITLMLCPAKILLSALLPCGDGIWAAVICTSMKITDFLATCGAESNLCVPVTQVAYWQSMLFYAAFVWILVFARGALKKGQERNGS